LAYPRRAHAHGLRSQPREKWHDDPGGVGTAIVREVVACPACAMNA
jgi:hypothetical protein